ncbi:aa3-type cytochrome oxidase subunit CtaJ [Nakamurella endophytica]|uniref:Uncharacterized protein n=1 Tax=Nakamurella endophytica TaxID=1748367 RepID=A0A917T192_9ACTN|nr:hypothetical protein [Nakamurella endophytica]GGM06919.1 hypothetical protein GCM10011594_28650 [Nakamurella endophytica]
MTVLQTLAVFVGAPLVIYLVIAASTLLPGRKRRRPQYRPGEPWTLPAQWWAGDQPLAAVDRSLMISGSEGGARGNW